MFTRLIEIFKKEVSPGLAFEHVRAISSFHRIQASPGYRQAAEFVVKRLTQYGLDATITSYPATKEDYFWGFRSFQEWHVKKAELRMIEPYERKLANFLENEISLIQKSNSTPPEGIKAELIVVENAEEHPSYQSIDVKGKIVLVRGNIKRVHQLAIETYGAVGIISENMGEFPPVRLRKDLYDATQYTSFFWGDEKVKGFGFAVSPRVGDELRALSKENKILLHATVDAEIYDGTFESVEAFIPGREDKEILLVSHLCHPKPGANDNASGAGALLETARILKYLIDTKQLQAPRYGIRFLFVPEFTGTFAYLASREQELHQIIAGLNLDMVGGKMDGRGPLTIESPSKAIPSITGELAYKILQEITKEGTNYSKTTGYSLINLAKTPFSGGSDHYILSDPTVGIPCPMVIQWPDKYYHTDADTIDHIDPNLLGKVAVLAATYAYWIADLKWEDLKKLLNSSISFFNQELLNLVQSWNELGLSQDEKLSRLSFFHGRQVEDILSVKAWLSAAEIEAFNAIEVDLLDIHHQLILHIKNLIKMNTTEKTRMDNHSETDPISLNKYQKRFKRKYLGPIDPIGFINLIPKDYLEDYFQLTKQERNHQLFTTQLIYWMDGKKTVEEILDCVEMETNLRNDAAAFSYLELLEKIGLINVV